MYHVYLCVCVWCRTARHGAAPSCCAGTTSRPTTWRGGPTTSTGTTTICPTECSNYPPVSTHYFLYIYYTITIYDTLDKTASLRWPNSTIILLRPRRKSAWNNAYCYWKPNSQIPDLQKVGNALAISLYKCIRIYKYYQGQYKVLLYIIVLIFIVLDTTECTNFKTNLLTYLLFVTQT